VWRTIKLGSFHIGSSLADLLTSAVWNRVLITDLGVAAEEKMMNVPAASSERVRRTRHLLAMLIPGSGASGVIGACWDELWHRMYRGFGDDFLWPPHLLLYASLGMNVASAGIGLGIAPCGRGGLRERFRAATIAVVIPAGLCTTAIFARMAAAWLGRLDRPSAGAQARPAPIGHTALP
jgi:hypothetical protein